MISQRRAAAATLGFAWSLSACGGDGFRFDRGLAISPQRLDKSWGSGSDMQPYPVAVQLPEGVTEYTVTAPPYIQVQEQTPSGFKLVPLYLSSGEYDTTVTVRAGDQTVQLPVHFTVNAPFEQEHDLILGSTEYALVANEGELSDPVTLAVTFPTWERAITMDWEYLDDTHVNWLEFGADMLMWANASSLAPGNYQVLLKIGYTTYRGVRAQKVVTVSLTVNPRG